MSDSAAGSDTRYLSPVMAQGEAPQEGQHRQSR